MGGEETQEGPYYNADTLDDGRIIAPGYVNCLICTRNTCKKKESIAESFYYVNFGSSFIMSKVRQII
jgi:hypothetical protein